MATIVQVRDMQNPNVLHELGAKFDNVGNVISSTYLKAVHAHSFLSRVAVIYADSWVESSGIYSYPLSVVGLLSGDNCKTFLDIKHVDGTAQADWETEVDAYSAFTATGWAESGTDVLTLYCYEPPENDFHLSILAMIGEVADASPVPSTIGTAVVGTATVG